jgi:peptidoglycan/LPS O-acetylase OafA/YrhL
MVLHIFSFGLGEAIQPWIVHEGYLAVDFFFFLSGYILAGTYGGRMIAGVSARSYLDFVMRRLGRLFPMHWAVLAGIVLLHPVYTPMRIVEEATLTQRWCFWPAGDYDWINLPAWSISTEWAASLLFPAFVWAGLRGSSRRSWITAIACAAGLVWTAYEHEWNLNIWRSSVTYLPLARCFADFGLGVVGYRARLAAKPLTSDLAVTILFASVVLTLALEASDVVIAAVIFPTVVAVAGNAGRAAKLLLAEPLHWLGTISYSIYLTHYPIVHFIRRFWTDVSTDGSAAAYAFTTAAVTIATASVTYRVIEVPCRDLLKGWAGRLQARPAFGS